MFARTARGAPVAGPDVDEDGTVADIPCKHVVTVHYTGSFDDGEVFDTTRGRTPLTYVEGDHEVVPGFEAAVLTMQPGETKRVHLEPKDAYGERQASLIYSMPTVLIPNYDDLVVGEMIYLMNSDGYQQLARVAKVEDDGDTIFDFNHLRARAAEPRALRRPGRQRGGRGRCVGPSAASCARAARTARPTSRSRTPHAAAAGA